MSFKSEAEKILDEVFKEAQGIVGLRDPLTFKYIKSEIYREALEALDQLHQDEVRKARVSENRTAQLCFDGMTSSPGDKFSKCFVKLIERQAELKQGKEN